MYMTKSWQSDGNARVSLYEFQSHTFMRVTRRHLEFYVPAYLLGHRQQPQPTGLLIDGTFKAI